MGEVGAREGNADNRKMPSRKRQITVLTKLATAVQTKAMCKEQANQTTMSEKQQRRVRVEKKLI